MLRQRRARRRQSALLVRSLLPPHTTGNDRATNGRSFPNPPAHARRRIAALRREIASSGGGARVAHVVVGTGHHTRGKVRLPQAARECLERELGLRVREPQAGLLEVLLTA